MLSKKEYQNTNLSIGYVYSGCKKELQKQT